MASGYVYRVKPLLEEGGGGGGGDANLEYHTTEYYNSHPMTVYPKGTIIVYSDYKLDDEGKLVPGIKISDGLAYVVDLPFITEDVDNIIEEVEEALQQVDEAVQKVDDMSETVEELSSSVDSLSQTLEEKSQVWDNKINVDNEVLNETLVITRS